MTGTENIFNAFGLSDVGIVRQNNEDAFLCLPQYGVFCVADGMGGMRDGAIASQTTVNCVEQAFTALNTALDAAPPPTFKQRHDALIAALEEANRRMQPKEARDKQKRCGSTVVSLLLDPSISSHAMALHAGDSRLYRLRGSQLQQLTQDHSGTALLEKMGKAAAKGKLATELRGVVTRGIGLAANFAYDETDVTLYPRDVLILCSDGLTNMLPDETIGTLLENTRDQSIATACRQLVDAANAAGGLDNITVVIIRVGDIPEPVTAEIIPTENDTAEAIPPITDLQPIDRLKLYLFKRKIMTILALVFLAILAVISLALVARARRINDDWRAPPASKAAIQAEPKPNIDRETLVNQIELAHKNAQISGNWHVVQSLIDKGNNLLTSADEQYYYIQASKSWYALWIQAAAPGFDVNHRLVEFKAHLIAEAASIMSFGGTSQPLTWPTDRADIASRFCSAIQHEQNVIIDAVTQVRDTELTRYHNLLKTAGTMMNSVPASEAGSQLSGAIKEANRLRGDLLRLTSIVLSQRGLPWIGTRGEMPDWDNIQTAFNKFRDQIAHIEQLLGSEL